MASLALGPIPRLFVACALAATAVLAPRPLPAEPQATGAEPAAEPSPDPAELFRRHLEVTGSPDEWWAASPFVQVGRLQFDDDPEEGEFLAVLEGPPVRGLYRLTHPSGFGEEIGFTEDAAWSRSPGLRPELLPRLAHEKLVREADPAAFADPASHHGELTYVGTVEFDGVEAHEVRTEPSPGHAETWWFSVADGWLLGHESVDLGSRVRPRPRVLTHEYVYEPIEGTRLLALVSSRSETDGSGVTVLVDSSLARARDHARPVLPPELREAARRHDVSGRVLQSGRPRAGITVRIEGHGEAVTDEEGRFAFEGVSGQGAGQGATLTVDERLFSAREWVDLDGAAGDVTGVTLNLQGRGRVVGRVTDERGRPVEGAVVAAARWNGHGGAAAEQATAADGRYELVLDMAAVDFVVSVDDQRVAGPDVLLLAPGRELVHDVTIPTATRVRGLARDRRGRALPRTSIVAEGAPGECLPWCHEMATTSDTGEFTLSITRPALYHVHVEGEPEFVAVSLPPEGLDVAERLDLTLPGVVVSGRVESAPRSTAGIDGVILRRSRSSTQANYQFSRKSPLAADGSFAFHGVSPGAISLETHFWLAEVPVQATFTVGKEDIVDVRLPAPNIRSRATPGIAEDWNRAPPLVPDVELDAELKAELEAFKARQRLEESLEADAPEEGAETRDVRIRLVAAEDGGPVTHGHVYPLSADLHAEPADPWGTFDIAGAPLDELEISCGGAWREERQVIVPATVTEVTVEMQPLARLEVLLVDEDARPLADWTVVPASEREAAGEQEPDADLELMAHYHGIDPRELMPQRSVTSSRGEEMLDLPLGEHEIVLTSPDGGRTERVTIDIGVAGPHRVFLRIGPDDATLARHAAPIRAEPAGG